ncbi:MAG: P-type conjugative transfer protein TrbL [Pseudomonadota bacterium]
MPFLLWLALVSCDAQAAIDSAGILDNALTRYNQVATGWAGIITTYATTLFWALVNISMVWTFGMMALRKADIGEFFAEFIRFTVFTGFFWWLLLNGPGFANDIIASMRKIGSQAAGTGAGQDLTPSGIVDIGFAIFSRVLDQSSIWSLVDSVVGILISAIVLVVLALIGVNMLLLLISGWVLAFAGIFFLGFGGSRWTSDMAINYFKTILSIAAQLFTMVLLVGVGRTFIDGYFNNMSAGITLKELGVMLVVAVVLLALVNKVPPLVGGLAIGGGAGSLGGGFGGGAALAAATVGAAAIAKAGAALGAAATSMAGAGQAVMAAYSKANASESGGGGGAGDLMKSAGGGGGDAGSGSSGGGSGGGGALASAMGDSGGGGSDRFSSGFTAGSSDFGSSFSSGAGSGSGRSSSSSGSGSSSNATASGTKGGAQGGGRSGMQNTSAGANPYAAQAKDRASVNPYADQAGSSAGANPYAGQTGSIASTNPYADMAGSGGGGAPGEVKSSSALASAGKFGRVAAGTVANLAQGAWDAAKAKASDRTGQTVGGKVATAINTRDAASRSDVNNGSAFDDNSLSKWAGKSADFDSEVSAFVNRDSTTS